VTVHSGYWEHLTAPDLAVLETETTVALLPVAAVEQHGPHLPLGTDAIISDGLVEGLLARPPDAARVLVLPSLRIGHSPEHADFDGTLSLDHPALLASWEAAAAGVARCGVRKLVLLNTHGGQTALVDLAAVRLRRRHGMLVARGNYFRFAFPPDLFSSDELAHGLHGGEVETSLMLHLRPDLVRLEALQDFAGLPGELAARHTLLGAERPVGIGWLARDLHPAGVCGNARNADAERGARAMTHLIDCLRTLCEELAAMPLARLAP
jgi:creatinine amidohydrolase